MTSKPFASNRVKIAHNMRGRLAHGLAVLMSDFSSISCLKRCWRRTSCWNCFHQPRMTRPCLVHLSRMSRSPFLQHRPHLQYRCYPQSCESFHFHILILQRFWSQLQEESTLVRGIHKQGPLSGRQSNVKVTKPSLQVTYRYSLHQHLLQRAC